MTGLSILQKLVRVGGAAVAIMLLGLFVLAGCQRRLYYFPRPYAQANPIPDPRIVALHYDGDGGRQTAFYRGPEDAHIVPDRLWVFFGGNGSLALEWLPLTNNFPERNDAFLYVDYPGFGLNPGHPTRTTIVRAATGALAAARRQIALDCGETSPAYPLGIVAHSMGCAAGLELATRAQPDRIVLIAPFTSLVAMARVHAGWPICELIADRYDNESRLGELARRSPRPAVTIISGTQDEVIPFQQGKGLAAEWPDWIRFHAIPGGTHGSVLWQPAGLVQAAMLGRDGES